MSSGNKRYLGDVFINKDNYEKQKEFFRDIIDSYQFKFGGKFDAATVQGKTIGDFATKEQGEKAERALLSPLIIGRQSIVNLDEPQYIYSDSILLDRSNQKFDELTLDHWYENLENDNLTDALVNIYTKVLETKNQLSEKKLDANLFNDFVASDFNKLKDSINEHLEVFTDQNGEEKTKINSDLVNGLRFCLITQEAYDNLPQEKKDYWRNIYIIRDASEIPPDYVDPMTWHLVDGYQFRIQNEALQINNGLSNEWKTLCSLSELMSGVDFSEVIQNFLSNESSQYTIPKNNLIESLANITQSNLNDFNASYPFLESEDKDKFIHSLKINNSSENIVESVEDGFKNINVDLNQILLPKFNTIEGSISAERAKLNQARNQIDSMGTVIDSIVVKNTKQDTSITEITEALQNVSAQIESLRNTVVSSTNNINNSIKEITTWKAYYPQGLVKRENNIISRPITNRAINYFNYKLGLGFLYMNINHYHHTANNNKWVDLTMNAGGTKFTGKYPNCFLWAYPYSTVFSTYFNNAIVVLNNFESIQNGAAPFQVMANHSSNGFKTVFCHFVYKLDLGHIRTEQMNDYKNYMG